MQKEMQHLLNEKEVLLTLDCPFIVRLATCWQDPKLLYMLLEPCMGGELRTVMHSFPKNQIPERNARFYAACIVLALRHMHERDIVHRDLAPENLMVDDHGYIRLVDFGFSKVRPHT